LTAVDKPDFQALLRSGRYLDEGRIAEMEAFAARLDAQRDDGRSRFKLEPPLGRLVALGACDQTDS